MSVTDLELVDNFKKTKFGFEWGPMSIERHIENKGSVILSLRTAKVILDIHVTPSGEVKIFIPVGNSVSVVGSGRLNEKQKVQDMRGRRQS